MHGLRVCYGVEAVAFVTGTDVPVGHVAAQVQFVLSMGIDAL